jgi:hypothetical protein
MFDDGKNFLNLEIIYDNEVNDILYGVHALVLHGLLKYENEKLLELGVKTAQELFNKIKQNNTAEQKNFKILPPKELLIKKHINFDEKKEYFMSAVANIQGKYDLPDNATIGEYLVMWWTSFLNGLQDKYTMNLPSDVIKLLANRWGLDDKKQNIRNIIKLADNEKAKKWIQEFNNSSKLQELNYTAIKDIKLIFLELSVEVLQNVEQFLSVIPDKTIQKIVKEYESGINILKAKDDPQTIAKINKHIEEIEKIGGIDKLMPTEGLVFTYNGKKYKMTGLFTPIHKILSLIKF